MNIYGQVITPRSRRAMPVLASGTRSEDRGIGEEEITSRTPSAAERALADLDRPRVLAVDGVVAQQVPERVGIRQIVHRDEIDVLVAERRPHDVAPDPSEPVDCDFYGHGIPPAHAKVEGWVGGLAAPVG